MKKERIMLYLFVICYMVLSPSKCEATLRLRPRIQQGSLIPVKQLQMYNSSSEETYQEVNQVVHPSDMKRAKGTYGGGDLLRPRTGHKNSGGVAKPPSLLIMGISQVEVGLLFLLFFF